MDGGDVVEAALFVEAFGVGGADHDEGELFAAGGALHAGDHGSADALAPMRGMDGELADLGSAGHVLSGEVADDFALFDGDAGPADAAVHEFLDEGSADPGAADGFGESLGGDADHSGNVADAGSPDGEGGAGHKLCLLKGKCEAGLLDRG